MDAVRYRQVKALLLDALEMPAAAREAFLAGACGDDVALRAEVEALLVHESNDGFLETPAVRLMSANVDAAPSDPETDPRLGAVVDQYRVISRLGAGGMGVVYLAEDTRLGRRVALKFLHTDRSVGDESERFVREARAIASLDHPNICTLYGIHHTTDRHMFLAMAYYEGETLKQRLARGRPPLAASLDIARQIAGGLAAAHAAGVVHRDVKPANVMLCGALVKVLDFGIAKVADQAALTLLGTALGTAAYMAPEQAEGRAVDYRADIWALGAVVYEMVTGRLPFEARGFASLVAGATGPPRPRSIRPDVPADLEACVLRALTLDPGQRFSSMTEFASALEAIQRRYASAITVFVTPSGAPSTTGGDPLSEAVGEIFADTLSSVASLRVVAAAPAFGSVSLFGSGDTGAMTRATDQTVSLHCGLAQQRLVLTARMTDATGWLLDEWRLEGDPLDLPSMIARIVRGIATAAGVGLSVSEQRLVSAVRSFTSAGYLAYIEGRRQLSIGTATGYETALRRFDEARIAGPSDALPYAGIVEACVGLIDVACASDRAPLAARASQAADVARRLDANGIEVRFALAECAYRLDWALDVAEERLRELTSVHPGHWRAGLRLAECLIASGQFAEGTTTALAVAERRPRSGPTLLRAGRVLYFARAYDHAVRVLEAASALPLPPAVAPLDLALALTKTGQAERIGIEAHRALSSADGQALVAAAVGNAARATGNASRHQAARRLLSSMHGEAEMVDCAGALLDTAFGDTDRPFEYWDAYDETLGVGKFIGLTAVPGSLASLVPKVGLVAFLGVEPSFEDFTRTTAVTTLLARLDATSGS